MSRVRSNRSETIKTAGKFPSEEKFGLVSQLRFLFHPISPKVRPATQQANLFSLSPIRKVQLRKSTLSFGFQSSCATALPMILKLFSDY